MFSSYTAAISVFATDRKRVTLRVRGAINAPCGVPCSVSDHWPYSDALGVKIRLGLAFTMKVAEALFSASENLPHW
jgi:hypothetical protein